MATAMGLLDSDTSSSESETSVGDPPSLAYTANAIVLTVQAVRYGIFYGNDGECVQVRRFILFFEVLQKFQVLFTKWCTHSISLLSRVGNYKSVPRCSKGW